VGPNLFTRSGVIISAAVHGTAVLLVVLFAGADPFDSQATEAIAVDIVSPSEAPPVPDWSVPTDTPVQPPKPQFDVAALTTSPPQMPSPSAQQPEAKPAQVTQNAVRESRRSDAPASLPVKGQVSGSAQPPPPQAQPPQAQPPQARPPQAQPPQIKGATTEGGVEGDQGSEKQTNVANMFGMPLALPDGRLGGAFDAAAIETAKIERSSVDSFREHIKSCTMLPAGVSPSDRVSLVIRIALNRDGMLAGQPILIEASASPKGPAVLQSLFAGLQKCQPFNMLPPDRYQEWRTLDIRFTPQDLGQG
jgi:hypothetical protein